MNPTASRSDERRSRDAEVRPEIVPFDISERTVEETLYRLRATVHGSGSQARVTELTVETKHPKFPSEQCPAFVLTPLLEHAAQLSPRTLQQIVDPDCSDEMRREAIHLLVFTLALSPALTSAVQCPVVRAPELLNNRSQGDELEPSFSIETRPSTTFHDFLRGVCTKEVLALRNDQAVVRFEVTQNALRLERAIIQAVPVKLSWPLLDGDGAAVTLRTVDQAIVDFSTLLYGMRAAKWGVSVRAVAEELECRQAVRLEGQECSPGDSFVLSLLACVPDEQPQSMDRSVESVASALAPEGRDLRALDLDDGRVVWLGLEGKGECVTSSRLLFAGCSSSGAEYRVEVSVPFVTRRRLSRIHSELLDTRRETRFSDLLDRAVRLPGARGLCLFKPDPMHFPQSINALLRGLALEDPSLSIERGGWRESFSLFSSHEQARVLSVVKGLSPFRAERVGVSPARSWRFEAALDESLSGTLFARNNLGDRVYVTLRGENVAISEKSEFLRESMGRACLSPEEQVRLLMQAPGGRVRVERCAAPQTLLVLDSVALKWQQALLRSGRLKDLSCSEAISWWVDELPRGRCSLSILPVKDHRFSWAARHALVVGPDGLEAAYLSVGNRSFLGFLRGAAVTIGAGQVPFLAHEEEAILRVLASPEASTSQDEGEDLLRAVLPYADVKRRVVMRKQDPFRDDKDLLQIAYNWVERNFGS